MNDTDLITWCEEVKRIRRTNMLSRSHVSPIRVTRRHFTSDKSSSDSAFVLGQSVTMQTSVMRWFWVLQTHRFHYGWKAPLCAEESFTVETSPFVDVSVQHIHPNHTGVHRVGILLHSSLGHCFPRMAVVKKKQ